MRLGLKGPAFTVSNSTITGENSIELASAMLLDESRPLCVVTCVDSIVTQLRLDNQKPIGSQGEGAGTLVLARTKTAKERGWPVLAVLKSIEYGDSEQTNVSGYHSDAIERLVEHIAAKNVESPLALEKPDGRKTLIHLEPAS
jgi:3-oxoacyl-(acyl-carrier-protein) synthase